MSRKAKTFEDDKHFFEGVDVIEPTEYINSKQKVDIRCIDNKDHIYSVSVYQIKYKDKDPTICEHCKKQNAHADRYINYTEIKEWADDNNLTIVNQQDSYNKNNETLHLKCKTCSDSHNIKHLRNWSNTKLSYECKSCKVIEQENSKDEFDLGKLTDSLRNKIANQTKWTLKYYINTRANAKFQCNDCGNIKECLPYSLFIGKGGGCDSCRRSKFKQ